MYSPSHCQAGAPVSNFQLTLHNTPELVKMFNLQYYLVAAVIHILSPGMCIHMLFTGQRCCSGKDIKKLGQQ
jgi:hypothetical protein